MANSQDPNTGGGSDPKPQTPPAPKPTTPKPSESSRFVRLGVNWRKVGRVVLYGILISFALFGLFMAGAILAGKLPVQRSMTTTPAKKLPNLPNPITITVKPDGSGEVTRVIYETFQVGDPYNMSDADKKGIQEKLNYLHPQKKNAKRSSVQNTNPVFKNEPEPVAETPQKPTGVVQQPSSVEESSPLKPANAKAAVVTLPAETANPQGPLPRPDKSKKAMPQKTEPPPNPCAVQPKHCHYFHDEGEWCPVRETWVKRRALVQGQDIRHPNGNGMR